ncbi:hypothetical protein [Bradyrhizobium sp. RD5-C2]|uniref:hypothetical protein n=1 Tax=Bradyrhizobium sp. RD5-C2 TaxID=244562 RepID=UPI001CC55EC6|nr:hypothetical protein [Bradyrhizobium sp. RD5-C2]GIQ74908.1 hypothetical protein BraRD5C2_33490 [Bradyrhizobium sp. RD5-C2]
MPEYRAFIVGRDGHFIGFEELICADDDEASGKAGSLVEGHDVELWSGARLVVILRHQHLLSSEVHALNRQINESQRMSKRAEDLATSERMDRLTSDLQQEKRDQQKRDDES